MFENAVSVHATDSQSERDKRVRQKIEMLVRELDHQHQETVGIIQERDRMLRVIVYEFTKYIIYQ